MACVLMTAEELAALKARVDDEIAKATARTGGSASELAGKIERRVFVHGAGYADEVVCFECELGIRHRRCRSFPWLSEPRQSWTTPDIHCREAA